CGRPWEVVVDHPLGPMQVETLRRDVGGHEMPGRQLPGCGTLRVPRPEPVEHDGARRRLPPDARALAGAPGQRTCEAVAQVTYRLPRDGEHECGPAVGEQVA